jgi:hypothetical protein
MLESAIAEVSEEDEEDAGGKEYLPQMPRQLSPTKK